MLNEYSVISSLTTLMEYSQQQRNFILFVQDLIVFWFASVIFFSVSSVLPSMVLSKKKGKKYGMWSQSGGWVLKLCLLLHFTGIWYLSELQNPYNPKQLQTCFFSFLFSPTDWIREEGERFLRWGSFQLLSRSQYTTQQFHTAQLCGLW